MEGEFPFCLEYEIKRKRSVIQDTLLCEYDGIGQGKYREWMGNLASGKQQILLLQAVDKLFLIYCYKGSLFYFFAGKRLVVEEAYASPFQDSKAT
ncbi:putative uncharacterized domain protein [Brevibacillus laterosporus GI-9]|uniref:hypothetical protein n=1 Tax=Brevibacillus TaxID=55080 RepID=UPI00024047A4|nr:MULTISPECIES: hypothetical protein [Brevibacillus]MCR8965941.1 hypothetical protein [Brevibacillus laterosporus]MCZ0838097.1 hypothetical protein [Brevibacillus halotolerans]CCF12626.1 putative uncharacterized domain protein [Brevibacillus laterosporus GI-9]